MVLPLSFVKSASNVANIFVLLPDLERLELDVDLASLAAAVLEPLR